jgi:fumarylacetoacetate (FAA) hydrolase
MKLATLKDGSRDGRLVVVSRDLRQALSAGSIAPTMQFAIEHWSWVRKPLESLYDALNTQAPAQAFPFEPRHAMAPLPRTHQFVDASAFLNHGEILARAMNVAPKLTLGVPVLVQRQSDEFLGPCDDYPLRTETDNADLEGEFAVILDDTPSGSTASEAEECVRLVTVLNDMSMRAHVLRELQMGFGFFHAKTAPVFAPVAVTPDELGSAWQRGRVHLNLQITRNGEWFGEPNGAEMDWSFGELIAYLAYNRNLRAGTILGSGTVSNRDWRKAGSACVAEKRALEQIAFGEPRSAFLKYGDRVRLEALDGQKLSIFGAIDHTIVQARAIESGRGRHL